MGMDMQRIGFCDNKNYRQGIAKLAVSIYHMDLLKPNDDDEQQVIVEFLGLVRNMEEKITSDAYVLSKKYNVPIDMVHQDINECCDYLPKEDLKKSLELGRVGKLQ